MADKILRVHVLYIPMVVYPAIYGNYSFRLVSYPLRNWANAIDWFDANDCFRCNNNNYYFNFIICKLITVIIISPVDWLKITMPHLKLVIENSCMGRLVPCFGEPLFISPTRMRTSCIPSKLLCFSMYSLPFLSSISLLLFGICVCPCVQTKNKREKRKYFYFCWNMKALRCQVTPE